jgi:hypothetical protein
MSMDVLDDLLISDDDVSGSFALDELLGAGAEEFLLPEDLEDDFFSTLAEPAAK